METIETAENSLDTHEIRQNYRRTIIDELKKDMPMPQIWQSNAGNIDEIIAHALLGAWSLDELLEQLQPLEQLRSCGISRDKNGKWRLRLTGLGFWPKQGELREFVIRLLVAKTEEERITLKQRLREYFITPFEIAAEIEDAFLRCHTKMPESEMEEEPVSQPMVLRRSIRHAIVLAIGIMLIVEYEAPRNTREAPKPPAPAEVLRESGPPAAPPAETPIARRLEALREGDQYHMLQRGETPWSVTRSILREKLGANKVKQRHIETATRAVCMASGIRDRALGIMEGSRDSRRLKAGQDSINIKPAHDFRNR